MENLLAKWEREHFKKITSELRDSGIEICLENIPKIIEETSFRVRSKKFDGNECPYYAQGIQCHPDVSDLNCLLCACPNYDSSTNEGRCRISSKRGKFTYHKNLPTGRVWDCSDCSFAHNPEYISKWLENNIGRLKELY